MLMQTELRPRNSVMSQSAIMSGVMLSNRPLQNMNCILQPETGKGALFLGDVVSTLKDSVLEVNRIKAILTCMAQNHHLNRNATVHKVMPIKDTLQYPIYQHFDQAVTWIEAKRSQGLNVLVHCHAGVSRSATIVTAYLMRFRGWTATDALNFVRSKRERAKPNLNFWAQLTAYQQNLLQKRVEQNSLNLQKKTQFQVVQQVSEKSSPTRQYRKRRIFQTPPIHQNHRPVSTQYLPLKYHQGYSQSIVFNTARHNFSQIQENSSTVNSRIMNNSMRMQQSKIYTPQQAHWRPHITMSLPLQQNNNPQHLSNNRVRVSPFELGNLSSQ